MVTAVGLYALCIQMRGNETIAPSSRWFSELLLAKLDDFIVPGEILCRGNASSLIRVEDDSDQGCVKSAVLLSPWSSTRLFNLVELVKERCQEYF